MHTPDRLFRVAMASHNRGDNAYGSFRGVLDYKEHTAHWQMVGVASAPITAFEDVDLSAVDGVIGFFRQQQWVDAVRRAGVAAVNLSTGMEEAPLPRVGNDDEAIGRMGAEHLLERGFIHFGFLSQSSVWYSQRRMAGYRSVIQTKAGRECHVFDAVSHALQSNRGSLIGQWLAQLPKPVAVMATNDWLGCEAIEAAGKCGLRVPDDVAVVGVDNDRWLTQLANVPMSSVEPDWRQVGYRGGQLLDGLMAGELPTPTQWIPPLRVVGRRSTDIVLNEDPVVSQALQYIRDHCHTPIGVENVLGALGISRRNLETRMKRAIGQTPHAALNRARIERAKGMLVQSDATLAAIATSCGIKPDQFYIVFKRLTGITPGQYRRKYGSPVA